MEPTNQGLLHHPKVGDDVRRYRWTMYYITVIITLVFIIELIQLFQEGTL